MQTVSAMYRFFRWSYPVLYNVLLGLYLPRLLFRVIFEGKRGLALLQRAGRIPRSLRALGPPPEGCKRIWLHAVSVGEVNAIKALVKSLNSQKVQLFVSTTTETGQALAKTLFGDIATVFYYPLDWKWVIHRYLKVISPRLLILTEAEFWPGMIWTAGELQVPLLLVNGRISDRSFGRYRKLRFIVSPLLSGFGKLCMQSRESKSRILELGAPPDRVRQVGNLKYDYHLPAAPAKEQLVRLIRKILRGNRESPIWVCASTKPGEEEILLGVFDQLRSDFPDLRLIVAPRHPNRAESIERLFTSAGLRTLKRTELQESAFRAAEEGVAKDPPDVFLLDSIGELPYLYQIADVVFMGGSLVPTGGQNIIEAAHFAKPILFGPHMENFREISQSFLECYGALQVQEAAELAPRIRDLLRDTQARAWLGRNARKVVRDNQGALQVTLEIVNELLSEQPSETGGEGER